MKKVSQLLLIYFAFFFSGCASILNGKYQSVSVFTNSSDANVYVDGEKTGSGKFSPAKIRRDLKVHQVKVDSKGYKPEYKVAFQTKKSPLLIMSWIPFGALMLVPPLYDRGQKSWNYEKELTINTKTKINAKDETQKYIYLKNTSFEVSKEDLVIEQFSHRRYNKNKKSRDVTASEKEVNIDNSIFTDALNDILKTNGFIDTTNTVLKSKTNTMFISAKVSKVTFKRISSKILPYNAYCIAETTVEWDLLDIYEQSKYTKKVVSQSGEFANNYDLAAGKADNSFVVRAMEDALTTSFFTFLDDPATKELLQKSRSKKETFTRLNIKPSANKVQSLKNAQSSTVSVVTKAGHGSGCIISDQGYVVTNYHVVAGQKDLEVILNTGDKYKASLVRANEDGDLALLSLVNAPANLAYFKLPVNNNYEVGDEVFAIGTPKSLELSQTLSKGIISGLRKLPDNSKLIQTDVSVNAGNSGGALVSKQGEFLGVVNSKLVGFGVEGISFCIPAVTISEMLSLE